MSHSPTGHSRCSYTRQFDGEPWRCGLREVPAGHEHVLHPLPEADRHAAARTPRRIAWERNTALYASLEGNSPPPYRLAEQ